MQRRLASCLIPPLLLFPGWTYAIDEFPTFNDNCYNFKIGNQPQPTPVPMIHDSVRLGLNVRQTEFFQSCIRNSGYQPCSGDPSSDPEDGVRVALSSNHLVIGCQTVRQGVQGEARVGTQLLHTNDERVALGSDALHLAGYPSGIRRRVLAGTIWHEAAHTHGYDHNNNTTVCTDSPASQPRPSMNHIIGDCMQQAADEMVRVEFRLRIADQNSLRPGEGELDTLLKALTHTPPFVGGLGTAVEQWLEGPDFRVRGPSGGYLGRGNACSSLDYCFIAQPPGAAPVGHVWHIVPEFSHASSPWNRPGMRVRVLDVSEGLCLKYIPAPVEAGLRPYAVGRCNGEEDEWWTIGPMSVDQNVLDRGLMQVHPGNDHTRCLAINPNNQNSLTIVADCTSSDADLRFEYLTDQSQAFMIRTDVGRDCLDVPGGTTDLNTRLQVYPCHGGGNQLWRLRRPPQTLIRQPATTRGTEYLIQNDATGLCVRATTSGLYQTACEPPCDPRDFRCVGRMSRATPVSVRGYGSVFVAGYGYLQGYGNTFIVKTQADDRCLARYWSGTGLEMRPCLQVEQDSNSHLRWRFVRAR